MKLKPETIQQHRARQAEYLRKVHKLCTCSNCELQNDGTTPKDRFGAFALALMGIALLAVFVRGCDVAQASELIAGYPINSWTTAIYHAEGGAKTRHPYGILAKYKHTTPKQACINTILRAWKRYKAIPGVSESGFLTALQKQHCPIGSNTDDGTCKYWKKNVDYYLKHPKGA